MNSEEIYKCLKSNPDIRDHFLGVFSSNELPPKKTLDRETGKYLIVNYDHSSKPGSHWVAMRINPLGRVNIYFDSYGWPPFLPTFETYMDHHFRFNATQLQHKFSTTCGQWCCYFIWNQIRGINTERMIKKLETFTQLEKDHIVNHFVETVFQTDQKVIDKVFLLKQISGRLQDNRGLSDV